MPYKDIEKAREANRRSYHKYREERVQWSRDYYQRNKSKKAITSRFGWIRRAYGLSPEDFENMWRLQNGCCAICQEPLAQGYKVHIDHDHETNKVRGILCKPCNNGIGFLQDNPEILRKAAEYLEEWRERNG